MTAIRYAIADDHAIFRQGIKYSLSSEEGLEFAGEAGNGKELLLLLDRVKTDVVLLDLKMPEMDGIEATKEVRRLFPEVKIIVLTMQDDEQYIIHLLDLGANGYLVKNAEPKEIITAIYSAHESGYYFSDMVSKTMLKSLVQKKHFNPRFGQVVPLDEREIEILQLICREHTTAEIADKIFLSQRTVEGIRAGMLEKTGTRNIAGLVLYAVKQGLIS